MYASVQKPVSLASVFRYCGRAGALIAFITWLNFVLLELLINGLPVTANYYQGAMLAVVFFGYAVGWQYEAIGGAFTILGTIGFFALNAVLFGYTPLFETVGFAVPGIFYLIAHYLEGRHVPERG